MTELHRVLKVFRLMGLFPRTFELRDADTRLASVWKTFQVGSVYFTLLVFSCIYHLLRVIACLIFIHDHIGVRGAIKPIDFYLHLLWEITWVVACNLSIFIMIRNHRKIVRSFRFLLNLASQIQHNSINTKGNVDYQKNLFIASLLFRIIQQTILNVRRSQNFFQYLMTFTIQPVSVSLQFLMMSVFKMFGIMFEKIITKSGKIIGEHKIYEQYFEPFELENQMDNIDQDSIQKFNLKENGIVAQPRMGYKYKLKPSQDIQPKENGIVKQSRMGYKYKLKPSKDIQPKENGIVGQSRTGYKYKLEPSHCTLKPTVTLNCIIMNCGMYLMAIEECIKLTMNALGLVIVTQLIYKSFSATFASYFVLKNFPNISIELNSFIFIELFELLLYVNIANDVCAQVSP